jgi:lipoprotein-anchoring transpeptidase ErfK/SrfK
MAMRTKPTYRLAAALIAGALALSPAAALADATEGASPAPSEQTTYSAEGTTGLSSDVEGEAPVGSTGSDQPEAEGYAIVDDGQQSNTDLQADPDADLDAQAPDDAASGSDSAASSDGSSAKGEPSDAMPSAAAEGQVSDDETPLDDGTDQSDAAPAPLLARSVAPSGRWVVTSSLGQGLQRYWFVGGRPAPEGLYQTPGGTWAYVRPEGYVVRGAYRASDGRVYLADNDGRLESPGWVVTAAYGQGLQRYWVDADAHACVPGRSDAGWAHYTRPEGYVLRGAGTFGGRKYCADNDGLLASGWVVTDSFGQGLQRYWFDASSHTTVEGYSSEGWAHYTRPEGYVVRGAYRVSNGYVYVANNDGLVPNAGWVVSSAYGQGLQRYWVDPSSHACVPGYSTAGWAHYTMPEGYVLRGRTSYKDGILLADNDGRVATATGWLVTSAYGNGLQRYYLEKGTDGIAVAKVGFFNVGNSKYFGVPGQGFELRNSYVTEGSQLYWADNDGVLSPRQRPGGVLGRIWSMSSPSNYLIAIDNNAHQVYIFRGSANNWQTVYVWDCGNGKASTPTVRGTFSVGNRGYSFGHGYTCYYYTQFHGDYLFHSILYYQNTFREKDGRLGAGVSHGCVRLSLDNAHWIYDNIPRGTTVHSF